MTHNSILTYFQIGHFLLNLLLTYSIAKNREHIINALRHTSGHDPFMLYVQKLNSELMLTEVRKKLMTEYIPDEIYGMIKVYVYGTLSTLLRSVAKPLRTSPIRHCGAYRNNNITY